MGLSISVDRSRVVCSQVLGTFLPCTPNYVDKIQQQNGTELGFVLDKANNMGGKLSCCPESQ